MRLRTIFILVIFISLKTIEGYSQVGLKLESTISLEYSRPLQININIESPNKKSKILLEDTCSNYLCEIDSFFTSYGEHKLIIKYVDNSQVDSTSYTFNVDSSLYRIRIRTSLNESKIYNEFKKKKIKEQSVSFSCFVSLEREKVAPNGIEIYPIIKTEKNEYYKEPFFGIKNNTSDTIYGEYLPNYLWGSIIIKTNGSSVKELPGRIDYNFAIGSPLYPDSIKIASVGSFGFMNGISQMLDYLYVLRFTLNEYKGSGYKSIYANERIEWHLRQRDLFLIEYENKIKNGS